MVSITERLYVALIFFYNCLPESFAKDLHLGPSIAQVVFVNLLVLSFSPHLLSYTITCLLLKNNSFNVLTL